MKAKPKPPAPEKPPPPSLQRPPPPKSAWANFKAAATGGAKATNTKSPSPRGNVATKAGAGAARTGAGGSAAARPSSQNGAKVVEVKPRSPVPQTQPQQQQQPPQEMVVVEMAESGAPLVPHYGFKEAAELALSLHRLAPSSSKPALMEESSVELIPDDVNAMAFKAFQIADTNHDGTIDENELFTVLKVISPDITLPETNRLYQAIDRNRSGRITFDEFVRAIVKYKWNFSLLDKKQTNTAPPPDEKDVNFEWEIALNQIHKEAKLGEGTFGLVFKAKWKGCPVAVKEIRGQITAEAVDDFRKEITLMSRMRHPHIVLFMGACTKGKLAIVTEFVNGGSMYDIIHKQGATFTLGWLLRVAYETALGMAYLHGMTPQIVHRDLKPMNILVDRESNHVKLIDFGLSCLKPNRQHLTETVGSPIWMAPELLRNEPYTEKVDVYSYSLCLLEFFTGETPYLQLNLDELIQKVGAEGQRSEIPEGIPVEARDLIRICWAHDPTRRPSFEAIIKHPVFASVI